MHDTAVGKLEGMRSFGRPRSRREESIKMFLEKIGWEGMYFNNLAQDGDR